MEELRIGDKCRFRYNSKSKWKEGRIADIDPTRRTMYKIEAYIENGTIINWPEVLKMCEGEPAGEMLKRNIPGWCFMYWLTEDNVQSIGK